MKFLSKQSVTVPHTFHPTMEPSCACPCHFFVILTFYFNYRLDCEDTDEPRGGSGCGEFQYEAARQMIG